MNLENPNKGVDYIHYMSGEQLCAEREFKAGADARLEALKETALYRNLVGMQTASDNAVIFPEFPNEKGWLVFIPEEQ